MRKKTSITLVEKRLLYQMLCFSALNFFDLVMAPFLLLISTFFTGFYMQMALSELMNIVDTTLYTFVLGVLSAILFWKPKRATKTIQISVTT
ncbi:unnamed protein product, partial [Mesorhabditis belari]|uniref:Uncharacterized protein n=1 Tax=Mesorhabditis belari TaxID=2138241 RepID=A0AAF3F9L1_9BILA